MQRFKITKEFTDGLLAGLVLEEVTRVPMIEGEFYKGILGTSGYIIRRVEPCKGKEATA